MALRFSTSDSDFAAAFQRLLTLAREAEEDVDEAVAAIIA